MPGVSPFEMRRRFGGADVKSLRVIDLTDPDTLQVLGCVNADLKSGDYRFCRRLAAAARCFGVDGIIAPSGALRGETTLVVFADAMRSGKVVEAWSSVQRPPRSLLPYLELIRLRGPFARAIRRLYRRIARGKARDRPRD